MMDSSQLIDALNEFLDGLERGDIDIGLIEKTCHSNLEFTSAIGTEVDGRTYLGSDGIREWFTDLLDAFEVAYEDRRFEVLGTSGILFLCRNRLRGKGSGADVTREIGILYEVDDGRFRRGVSYPSYLEGRKAAEAFDA